MNSHKYLIFLLILSMISPDYCEWTNPVIIDTEITHATLISSVFYDPVSELSHVIYDYRYSGYYKHFAISNDGKIVHQTKFNAKYAFNGIIRGPKDGKHLYLAMRISEGEQLTIGFTESEDGGANWSYVRPLFYSHDHDRYIQDMIYVQETGRIIIFYIIPMESEIHMISRPPDSNVFSSDLPVTTGTYNDWFVTKAAYTIDKQFKNILHVFFRTQSNLLAYMKSDDYGISWTDPLVILKNVEIIEVYGVFANSKITNKIFVAYLNKESSEAQLIYSQDNGLTFSQPITISTSVPASEEQPHGICLFGTNETPFLATLTHRQEKARAAFSIWDVKTMKKTDLDNPFKNSDNILNEGIDAYYESKQGKILLGGFIMEYNMGESNLTFSHFEGSSKMQ